MADYDPKAVVVTFKGAILTGYADGSFISAERNEDSFSLQVGAGGEFTRTRNRNESGRVTLTLLQTSPSNDILSAFLKLDEMGGLGKGPLSIKDLRGNTVVFAETAWLTRPASVEYGTEGSSREWVFETGRLEMNVGGAL